MMAGGAHRQSPARRVARQVHRWLGLTAGLLLVVMAVTGAGMAFRSQLEPLANRQLLRASSCAAPQSAPLPPSLLAASARSSLGGIAAGALSAIRLYADPSVPARVRFGDARWVYIDPCSGRVLGVQHMYGGAFGTLAWVHIAGYAPGGNVVAGLTALAVIVLGIAGIVLWWPQARRGNASPRARRAQAAVALAPAARRRHLHRSVAPWTGPVLLLLALTGLPQAFPFIASLLDPATTSRATPLTSTTQEFTPTIAPALATRVAPGATLMAAQRTAPEATLRAAPETVQVMALDLAWQAARAAPWRQMQWRMPRAAGEAVVLELTAAGAPHAYAAGIVHYDAATGRQIRRADYAQSGIGRKIYLWGLALHYGAVDQVAWQLVLFLAAISVPVLAWTGIAAWSAGRRVVRQPPLLELVLLEKRPVAQGICTFIFADPRGRKLPPWTAGAHLDVHIAGGLIRQYSLCGDQHDRRRYQIAVNRCTPSRGGSAAMHDMLQPGQLVCLGKPRNHFPLTPGAAHSVLLAGGIGITPILAMAESLAAGGASFELHYCVRTRAHAAFSDRLAKHHSVHLHVSGEAGEADFDHLLAKPPQGAQLYICGPTGFTDSALAAAQRQAWPADAVHTERFAAATVGQAGDLPFEVIVASSGQVIQVPADQTALDALHAAGVAVPDSCRQGICGTCITGVLDGEPDHRDQCLGTQAQAANNCFTPCCSRARSARLLLDL